jgi:hypothetical protein
LGNKELCGLLSQVRPRCVDQNSLPQRFSVCSAFTLDSFGKPDMNFVIRCMALVLSACNFLCSCSTHPPLVANNTALTDPNTVATSGSAHVEADLRRIVQTLAGEIGERNVYRPEGLENARRFIFEEFSKRGYGEVNLQPVSVDTSISGLEKSVLGYNIEVRAASTENETREKCTLIVGAHYDSKAKTPGWHDHGPVQPGEPGTPGANDNASGVAVLLYLAEAIKQQPHRCEIRFVAFVNEEPPFFETEAMGSLQYARSIVSQSLGDARMISLETLGCYSPRLRQKRPFGPGLFGLPDRPDYVAFLTNLKSRDWTESAAKVFAKHSAIEVRTLALPNIMSMVAWSDDWSFWQVGIPAFAATDTAFLRHDDYHELNDRAEDLDYRAMALVAEALLRTLNDPGLFK